MARSKITKEQSELMRIWYVRGLISCGEIAERMKVSRQTVTQHLRRMQVDTSKRKHVVKCHECGSMVSKTRAEVRKYERHFCSSRCYNENLRSEDTQAEIRRLKKLRVLAEDICPFGVHDNIHVYEKAGDIYMFPSREMMLEWKRTRLPMEVFSVNKGRFIEETYTGEGVER